MLLLDLPVLPGMTAGPALPGNVSQANTVTNATSVCAGNILKVVLFLNNRCQTRAAFSSMFAVMVSTKLNVSLKQSALLAY